MFDGNCLLGPLTAVSKLAILVLFSVVMYDAARSCQTTVAIPTGVHL